MTRDVSEDISLEQAKEVCLLRYCGCVQQDVSVGLWSEFLEEILD